MLNIKERMVFSPDREKIALFELTPRYAKLILAWYQQDSAFEIFEEFEEPIEVWEDVQKNCVIRPTNLAEVVAISKMFRKLCDSFKVTKATAYASASFRAAKNHYGFLEEIEIASGFKIRLMQEQDEISSFYNGTVNTVDAPKGVAINICDDYTQIIHYTRKNIINSCTLPFGSETIAKDYMLDDKFTPQERMNNALMFIKSQLYENINWIGDINKEEFKFVGAGEAFLSIGKISRKGKKYPLDMPHGYVMNDTDLENVASAISGLDFSKNARLRGISNKTVSYVAGGIAIAQAFFAVFGVNQIIESTSGVCTGVLFHQCIPSTMEKPIIDLLMYSLNCNMNFYPVRAQNMTNIYLLTTMLFRQLMVLHKLGRQYIRALKIACFMYDCGTRIRYNPTKKDALQVILNTRLFGVSHWDMVMGAFIAASQYSEEFSLSEWVRFKDIVSQEDLEAVKKLAVFLRIAVALDRTESGVITDVVCDVLGDSVIMKTVTQNGEDVSFEISCAKDADVDFKKVFSKNLEIL
ncbi:MAG: hypothetical protein IKQ31_03800 [Clostridia bacterium]|nr:hypothetical protein [Clostridia bacterium]